MKTFTCTHRIPLTAILVRNENRAQLELQLVAGRRSHDGGTLWMREENQPNHSSQRASKFFELCIAEERKNQFQGISWTDTLKNLHRRFVCHVFINLKSWL